MSLAFDTADPPMRISYLHRAGWDVFYYTAEQVFTHPHRLVADVREVPPDGVPRCSPPPRPRV